MFLIFLLTSFIFGTIIGSFLNVVVLRLNTGKSINGRSACFSCGTKLSAFELVPLWSFIFLKGKCKTCRSKISIQYPLVELLTGLVFLVVIVKIYSSYIISFFDVIVLLYHFLIFSILIGIAVYDIRHKIVPDILAFLFALFTFLGLFIFYDIRELFSFPGVLDLLAGPILFLPFFLLWLVSSGRWMGLGDAKLAIGVGFMLGLASGASAIIVGFWAGALFALVYMFVTKIRKGKSIGLKSEIPFAPFIIFGTFLSFVMDLDLLSLRSILYLWN